jgi:uncharacterized tellurite resistance protein B-like protein
MPEQKAQPVQSPELSEEKRIELMTAITDVFKSDSTNPVEAYKILASLILNFAEALEISHATAESDTHMVSVTLVSAPEGTVVQ